MDKQKIIEKIRAVMERADTSRGSTVEEAATAAAIAARLMAQHQVSQAELLFDADPEDIEAAKAEADDPMTRADILGGSTKTAVQWQVQLAGGIARANGCRCVYGSGYYTGRGRAGGANITILGRESAVATCSYIFKYLVEEIQEIAKRERVAQNIKGAGARRWGNSFRHGAVATLNRRMAQARRDALPKLEGNASTALVRTERALAQEKQRVSDFVDSIYGRLRSGRSQQRHDSHGYSAGRQAGEGIALPGGQKRLGR